MSDTALVIGQASQRAVAFIVAVARRFYSDRCLTHASALAYASLLSIVPLLALMFAVLKGLGVQQRLEPLLLSRLALDPETVTQIMGYIDRVNVGTLGTIGVAALMLTVVNVLGSVETSFNYIWRVRRSRSWLRKATDYLSVLLLTPFLLLGAVAITSSLQVQHVLQWLLGVQYVGDALVQTLRLMPLVMNAVALGVLYAAMPNRQPSMRAIVVGALVAGAAWQVVQVGYVMMQIGVAKYNAIYGALSQLPLLLVWLYISWAVVLAGAELAAVCEFGVGAVSDRRSVSRWAVALQVLTRAGQCFRGGGGAVEPRSIARELRTDADSVSEIAESLAQKGWLATVEGERPAYVLALDPTAIDLETLNGMLDTAAVPTGCDPRVRDLLAEVTSEQRGAWKKRSLSDLLAE